MPGIIIIFRLQRFGYLMVGGLLLSGVGGSFVPWIWRESVALQLTAPGLAEFVKFLPAMRTVQLSIERLYFLLPLFMAMVLLPLIVENRVLNLPRPVRWFCRLMVLPMALAALSPVWTPAILLSAEFRLQTILALIALSLSVLAPLFRWLPLRLLTAGLLLFSMVSMALPYWTFNQIQPSLSEVYRSEVTLGPGWWLVVSGLLISFVGALGTTLALIRGDDSSSNETFDNKTGGIYNGNSLG